MTLGAGICSFTSTNVLLSPMQAVSLNIKNDLKFAKGTCYSFSVPP
jgi:hypothetical protein